MRFGRDHPGDRKCRKLSPAIDDILAYTAQRLRNRIAQLKPGAYSFTTYLDDDGGGNEKAPIAVTVRVEGDRLDFDFAGSAPQSKGALNVPESGLKATVFYAVKALLDPGLLPNSGLFEAVKISAPEGSIVNPRFPAAVGARSITCQKIAGAIFGAFRGLLPPEEVMAFQAMAGVLTPAKCPSELFLLTRERPGGWPA